MSLVGKVVYTVNAKTNDVDWWVCSGEITAPYRGGKERLCMLRRNRKSCVLPKRCVFESRDTALAIARR